MRTREGHLAFTGAAYGSRAAAYRDSAVHAAGEDLDWMEEVFAHLAPRAVLDVGCGGGHVSYRAAAHAELVTACDLAGPMLQVVAAEAARLGLAAIRTHQAAADALPFGDGSYDVVASRFSAHHWPDVPAGLRQMRRVLKPGGTLLLVDSVAPAAPLLDSFVQAVELLRDPLHVRNYRVAEWVGMLGEAGFTVRSVAGWRLRLDHAAWLARTATPPVMAAAIRALMEGAPAEVAGHFALEADGSFRLDCVRMEAGVAG